MTLIAVLILFPTPSLHAWGRDDVDPSGALRAPCAHRSSFAMPAQTPSQSDCDDGEWGDDDGGQSPPSSARPPAPVPAGQPAVPAMPVAHGLPALAAIATRSLPLHLLPDPALRRSPSRPRMRHLPRWRGRPLQHGIRSTTGGRQPARSRSGIVDHRPAIKRRLADEGGAIMGKHEGPNNGPARARLVCTGSRQAQRRRYGRPRARRWACWRGLIGLEIVWGVGLFRGAGTRLRGARNASRASAAARNAVTALRGPVPAREPPLARPVDSPAPPPPQVEVLPPAAPPRDVRSLGRELFARTWRPDDPRCHGGDGLGPRP